MKFDTRADFNNFFTIVSIIGGLISLGLGVASWFNLLGSFPKAIGPYVVFAWVLFPPIFFWVDWVAFSDELNTAVQRDFAKHTHDLGRNIWIAFTAILAYLFGFGTHLGIGGT